MMLKFFSFLNIKKSVAVLTTLCFLFTMVFSQGAYAVVTPAPLPVVNPNAFKSIENYLLPFNIGRITDALYTGGNEIVINIQDLHSHAQAQRNISSILSALDKQYGLENVYVEGGIGQVDTSWLSSIEDKDLKEKILNNMLESGRLTGGEYYSVQTNKNKLLKGIEDKDTYINNLKRLNDFYSKKQDILNYVSFLKYTLNKVSQKYYTRDNLKLNRVVSKYEAGNLSAQKYFIYLLETAQKANINLKKYPNIIAFLQVLKKQEKLDIKKVNILMAELLNDLKAQVSYDQYQSLISKVSNKNKETEFYFDLYKIAKEKGLLEKSDYRTLLVFFEYLSLNQSLNPVNLTLDEKNLLQELNVKLSKTQNEKDIYFLQNYLEYFSGYLTNKLTANDYEYFINNMDRFKLFWRKYVDVNGIIELDSYFNFFSDFYKDNVERNRFFIKNILGKMPNNPKEGIRVKANIAHTQKVLDQLSNTKKVKVVITGGFHTYGFTKLLQDNNVSYIVITPNVTKQAVDADVLYENIFKEQSSALYNTLQKMLASQTGTNAILNRDVIEAFDSTKLNTEAKNILNKVLESNGQTVKVVDLQPIDTGFKVELDNGQNEIIVLKKDTDLTEEEKAIADKLENQNKKDFETFEKIAGLSKRIRELKREIESENADKEAILKETNETIETLNQVIETVDENSPLKEYANQFKNMNNIFTAKNVVLIGPSGSSKTTTAELVRDVKGSENVEIIELDDILKENNINSNVKNNDTKNDEIKNLLVSKIKEVRENHSNKQIQLILGGFGRTSAQVDMLKSIEVLDKNETVFVYIERDIKEGAKKSKEAGHGVIDVDEEEKHWQNNRSDIINKLKEDEKHFVHIQKDNLIPAVVIASFAVQQKIYDENGNINWDVINTDNLKFSDIEQYKSFKLNSDDMRMIQKNISTIENVLNTKYDINIVNKFLDDQNSLTKEEEKYFQEEITGAKKAQENVEFGTAGHRKELIDGEGIERFNPFIVYVITDAEAQYINDSELHKNVELPKIIFVGYDRRYMGKQYAEIVAKTFRNNGITVDMPNDYLSTPAISNQVKNSGVKYAGSVNITASHNPGNYNGYKVNDYLGGPYSSDVTNAISAIAKSEKIEQKDFKGNFELSAIKARMAEGSKQKAKINTISADKFRTSHVDNVWTIIKDMIGKKMVSLLPGTNVIFDANHSALEPEVMGVFEKLGSKLKDIFNSGKDVAFEKEGDGNEEPEPNEENTKELKNRLEETVKKQLEKTGKLDAETIRNIELTNFAITTDPDGDRFGIYYVEYNGKTFDIKFATPDEIGSVVQLILLENLKNMLKNTDINRDNYEKWINEYMFGKDKEKYTGKLSLGLVKSADTTDQFNLLAQVYEQEFVNILVEKTGLSEDTISKDVEVVVDTTDIGYKNLSDKAQQMINNGIKPVILLESSGGLVAGLSDNTGTFDKDGLIADMLPIVLLQNANMTFAEALKDVEEITGKTESLGRHKEKFEGEQAEKQKQNFLNVFAIEEGKEREAKAAFEKIPEISKFMHDNNCEIESISKDTTIVNGCEIVFKDKENDIKYSLIIRASGTEPAIRVYTKIVKPTNDTTSKLTTDSFIQLGKDLIVNSGNGKYVKNAPQSTKKDSIYEKGKLQLTTIKDSKGNDLFDFDVNENLIEDGFEQLKADNKDVVKNPFEKLDFDQAAKDIKKLKDGKVTIVYTEDNKENIADAQAFVALSGNVNNIDFAEETTNENRIDVTIFSARRILAIAVLLSTNRDKEKAKNLVDELNNLKNNEDFQNIVYQALYASEVSGTNVEKFNAYFPGADGLRNYLFKTFPNRNSVVTEGPQLQHSIGQSQMAARKSFNTYKKSNYSDTQYNQYALPWYIIPMESQTVVEIGHGHFKEYAVNKNNHAIAFYPNRSAQSAAAMMMLFNSVGQAQNEKAKTERAKEDIENDYAKEINKYVQDEDKEPVVSLIKSEDDTVEYETKSTLKTKEAVEGIKGIKDHKHKVNDELILNSLEEFYAAINGGERVNNGESYKNQPGRPANHHVLEYVKLNKNNRFEIITNNKLTPEQQKMLEEHVKTINRILDYIGELKKQGVTTLIFNGIGGSDLGPRMIMEFLKMAGVEGNFEVRFVSSPSQEAFKNVTDGLEEKADKTAIIGMSKSGTTRETRESMRRLLDWKKINKSNYRQVAYVSDKEYSIKLSLCIALGMEEEEILKLKEEDREKKLDEFLAKNDINISDFFKTNKFGFDDSIGGRWSWISAIGMAVAMYNPQAFLNIVEGARSVSESEKGNFNNISLAMAAMGIKRTEIDGKEIQYIKITIDGKEGVFELKEFVEWYKQLIEESNGKGEDIEGKMLTKISSCESVEFTDGSQKQADLNIVIGTPETVSKYKDGDAEANLSISYDGSDKGRELALGKLLNILEKKVEAEGFMRGVNSYNQDAVEAAKISAGEVTDAVEKGEYGIGSQQLDRFIEKFGPNAQLDLGLFRNVFKNHRILRALFAAFVEFPIFCLITIFSSVLKVFGIGEYGYFNPINGIWVSSKNTGYNTRFFVTPLEKWLLNLGNHEFNKKTLEGLQKIEIATLAGFIISGAIAVVAIAMFSGSGEVAAHHLVNGTIYEIPWFWINTSIVSAPIISNFLSHAWHNIKNRKNPSAQLDFLGQASPNLEQTDAKLGAEYINSRLKEGTLFNEEYIETDLYYALRTLADYIYTDLDRMSIEQLQSYKKRIEKIKIEEIKTEDFNSILNGPIGKLLEIAEMTKEDILDDIEFAIIYKTVEENASWVEEALSKLKEIYFKKEGKIFYEDSIDEDVKTYFIPFVEALRSNLPISDEDIINVTKTIKKLKPRLKKIWSLSKDKKTVQGLVNFTEEKLVGRSLAILDDYEEGKIFSDYDLDKKVKEYIIPSVRKILEKETISNEDKIYLKTIIEKELKPNLDEGDLSVEKAAVYYLVTFIERGLNLENVVPELDLGKASPNLEQTDAKAKAQYKEEFDIETYKDKMFTLVELDNRKLLPKEIEPWVTYYVKVMIYGAEEAEQYYPKNIKDIDFEKVLQDLPEPEQEQIQYIIKHTPEFRAEELERGENSANLEQTDAKAQYKEEFDIETYEDKMLPLVKLDNIKQLPKEIKPWITYYVKVMIYGAEEVEQYYPKNIKDIDFEKVLQDLPEPMQEQIQYIIKHTPEFRAEELERGENSAQLDLGLFRNVFKNHRILRALFVGLIETPFFMFMSTKDFVNAHYFPYQIREQMVRHVDDIKFMTWFVTVTVGIATVLGAVATFGATPLLLEAMIKYVLLPTVATFIGANAILHAVWNILNPKYQLDMTIKNKPDAEHEQAYDEAQNNITKEDNEYGISVSLLKAFVEEDGKNNEGMVEERQVTPEEVEHAIKIIEDELELVDSLFLSKDNKLLSLEDEEIFSLPEDVKYIKDLIANAKQKLEKSTQPERKKSFTEKIKDKLFAIDTKRENIENNIINLLYELPFIMFLSSDRFLKELHSKYRTSAYRYNEYIQKLEQSTNENEVKNIKEEYKEYEKDIETMSKMERGVRYVKGFTWASTAFVAVIAAIWLLSLFTGVPIVSILLGQVATTSILQTMVLNLLTNTAFAANTIHQVSMTNAVSFAAICVLGAFVFSNMLTHRLWNYFNPDYKLKMDKDKYKIIEKAVTTFEKKIEELKQENEKAKEDEQLDEYLEAIKCFGQMYKILYDNTISPVETVRQLTELNKFGNNMLFDFTKYHNATPSEYFETISESLKDKYSEMKEAIEEIENILVANTEGELTLFSVRGAAGEYGMYTEGKFSKDALIALNNIRETFSDSEKENPIEYTRNKIESTIEYKYDDEYKTDFNGKTLLDIFKGLKVPSEFQKDFDEFAEYIKGESLDKVVEMLLNNKNIENVVIENFYGIPERSNNQYYVDIAEYQDLVENVLVPQYVENVIIDKTIEYFDADKTPNKESFSIEDLEVMLETFDKLIVDIQGKQEDVLEAKLKNYRDKMRDAILVKLVNPDAKRSLLDINGEDLKGKTVSLVVDLNAPTKWDEEKKKYVVTDSTRIDATIRTYKYLTDRGANVIFMSHWGRPYDEKKGYDTDYNRRYAELNMQPIADRFKKLGVDIEFVRAPKDYYVNGYEESLKARSISYEEYMKLLTGKADLQLKKKVEKIKKDLQNEVAKGNKDAKIELEIFEDIENFDYSKFKSGTGNALLLDNLRFDRRYSSEDKAKMADDFVDKLGLDGVVFDAFGVSHRNNFIRDMIIKVKDKEIGAVAGFLVEKELNEFAKVEKPKHPFVAILGGSKVSDKIGVINNLLDKMQKGDTIVIGGAMAYTFLKAQGYETGSSLVEDDKLELALELEQAAKDKGVRLLLPKDHIYAESINASEGKPSDGLDIPEGQMGVDIGPKTIAEIQKVLENVGENNGTIVWNGPSGVFENEAFSKGTFAVAKAVAEATDSGAFSIIGGGDSVSAANKAEVAGRISHISTGGGASLNLLEGNASPLIEVIPSKNQKKIESIEQKEGTKEEVVAKIKQEYKKITGKELNSNFDIEAYITSEGKQQKEDESDKDYTERIAKNIKNDIDTGKYIKNKTLKPDTVEGSEEMENIDLNKDAISEEETNNIKYEKIGIEKIIESKVVHLVPIAGQSSRMPTDNYPKGLIANTIDQAKKHIGDNVTMNSKAAVPVYEDGTTFIYDYFKNLNGYLQGIEDYMRENGYSDKKIEQMWANQKIVLMTNDKYWDEHTKILEKLDNDNTLKLSSKNVRMYVQPLGTQFYSTTEAVRLRFKDKNNDVYNKVYNEDGTLKENIKLSDKEQKIFEDYKQSLLFAAVKEYQSIENPEMAIYPYDVSPEGHGEIWIQLLFSGLLLELIDAGAEYVDIRNVDNIAAKFDRAFSDNLGYMISNGIDEILETSQKGKGMKGGGLYLWKGLALVIEGPLETSINKVLRSLGKNELSSSKAMNNAVATETIESNLPLFFGKGQTKEEFISEYRQAVNNKDTDKLFEIANRMRINMIPIFDGKPSKKDESLKIMSNIDVFEEEGLLSKSEVKALRNYKEKTISIKPDVVKKETNTWLKSYIKIRNSIGQIKAVLTKSVKNLADDDFVEYKLAKIYDDKDFELNYDVKETLKNTRFAAVKQWDIDFNKLQGLIETVIDEKAITDISANDEDFEKMNNLLYIEDMTIEKLEQELKNFDRAKVKMWLSAWLQSESYMGLLITGFLDAMREYKKGNFVSDELLNKQQTSSMTDEAVDAAKAQTTEIIKYANEWLQLQSLNIISLFKEQTEIIAIVDGKDTKAIAEAEQLAQQGIKVTLVMKQEDIRNNEQLKNFVPVTESGNQTIDEADNLSYELVNENVKNLKIKTYESVDGTENDTLSSALDVIQNIKGKKVLYVSESFDNEDTKAKLEDAKVLAYSSLSIATAIAKGVIKYKADKLISSISNMVDNSNGIIASYSVNDAVNKTDIENLIEQGILSVMIKITEDDKLEDAEALRDKIVGYGMTDVMIVIDNKDGSYEIVGEETQIVSYVQAQKMSADELKNSVVYVDDAQNIVLNESDIENMEKLTGVSLAFDAEIINSMDAKDTEKDGISMLTIVKMLINQNSPEAKKNRGIAKGRKFVIENGIVSENDINIETFKSKANSNEEKEGIELGVIQALELLKVYKTKGININSLRADTSNELLTMLGEYKLKFGNSYADRDEENIKIEGVYNDILSDLRNKIKSGNADATTYEQIIKILLTDQLELEANIEELADVDVRVTQALLSAA